ncbi:uncharacterized protein LOC109829003 [Asparagus officinalis]|nr:uncharacterized protein LOC109829003 [Asparagus officinalis]
MKETPQTTLQTKPLLFASFFLPPSLLMAKAPLTFDWNDLLSSKNTDSPSPEIEIVRNNIDPGFISALSDHQISEKIQRISNTLGSNLRKGLPDKGAKLRYNLRQLQDELDRRKLAKARKEANQEGDVEYTGSSNSEEKDSKVISTSTPSCEMEYKMKHGATCNMSEEFQILKSGIDSIASGICKHEPRVYSEEKLFQEVSKVEGLSEDSQLLAYDYLCGEAVRGRTFMGLPIRRRRRWLELKLGWASHKLDIGVKSERCS